MGHSKVPVVKMDGSIRICEDYKVTVNPALIHDAHPLLKVDDLFAAFSRGVIFSKLDLSQANLQLPKQHTTISTHKGLFQYECLPFDIACALPYFSI